MGFTYAKQFGNNNVIALDLLSNYFSHISTDHIQNSYMNIYLFNQDGLVTSSLNNNLSIFNEFYKLIKNFDKFHEAQIIKLNDKKYIVQINKIKSDYEYSYIGIFSEYDKTINNYEDQSFSLIFIFGLT